VLAGIKRTHGTARPGRAALLTDHLRQLLDVIQSDSMLGNAMQRCCCLGLPVGFAAPNWLH